ncbi:hypothetical protein SGRIM128S_07589 [Streptomyces griseomycini]
MVAGQRPAEQGTGAVTAHDRCDGRGAQTGEELPVLAEEVDHGVRRPRELGEAVREGVQLGLGTVSQSQSAEPEGACRGLLVLGGEQQTTGRARRVVAHGRAPGVRAKIMYGLREVCGGHMWAPYPVVGAGAWEMRYRTRVSRVWTPELEIRASQHTTGTSSGRSRAARTSPGS